MAKYHKARAHLNFSRRNAQEAREEKIAIINHLAEYYEARGLQVSGEKPVTGHGDGSRVKGKTAGSQE